MILLEIRQTSRPLSIGLLGECIIVDNFYLQCCSFTIVVPRDVYTLCVLSSEGGPEELSRGSVPGTNVLTTRDFGAEDQTSPTSMQGALKREGVIFYNAVSTRMVSMVVL